MTAAQHAAVQDFISTRWVCKVVCLTIAVPLVATVLGPIWVAARAVLA